MNRIIEENYNSIVKRGLINSNTSKTDFIMKLEEEVQEYIEAVKFKLTNENEELSDIILVCLNIAKHFNINIEQELKNKIQINHNRKQWKIK